MSLTYPPHLDLHVPIMTNKFTTLDMVYRTRSLEDIDPAIASDFEHSCGILYVNKESMHAGKERKKRRTSGPRIWLCSSSRMTDAVSNLDTSAMVASVTSHPSSFSLLSR